MESPCEDYVKDGWCFVAIKTRVGRKAGVDPKPGMRTTNPDKPKGATFNGKVQAMGFRFRSDEFVVPMRLSAFNGGDMHNIVYVLAEKPVAAANLPKEFVRKQLDGEQLYSNVTDLLPYKLQGGTEDDMSPNQWKELNCRRNPKPHNGVAAQLFAHDLLAGKSSNLTHQFEEKEKLLLDIGEKLSLRGGQMDSLHNQVLMAARDEAQKEAIELLKGMTLTVIEGDFPRDVVANQNIKFAPYSMESETALHDSPEDVKQANVGAFAVVFIALMGFVWLAKRKPAIVVLAIPALLLLGPIHSQARQRFATIPDLIKALDNPEESASVRALLQKKGRAAIPFLIRVLEDDKAPLIQRGYAITLLQSYPERASRRALSTIARNDSSRLVKLWCRAALVEQAQSPANLYTLLKTGRLDKDPDAGNSAWNLYEFPELQRPVALKLKDWSSKLAPEDGLKFLALGQKMGQARDVSPTVKAVVVPILRGISSEKFVSLMFSSKDQDVRRLSAGLLANEARKNPSKILSLVGEELALDNSKKDVPWAGGALFIPQFSGLSKTQSIELIGYLTRWSVWTELHNTPEAQVKPLENNLRSYNLWSRAGGNGAGWRNAKGASAWLKAYAKVAGRDAARGLLEEQDVSRNSDLWIIVSRNPK